MKKKFLKFTALAIVFTSSLLNAQTQNEEIKYKRSSLSMILIESDKFPNKDAVMSSWNNYPFPDKYNKHNIDLKSVNINNIKLSDQELIDAGFLKDTLKTVIQISKATASLKPLRYLNEQKTLALVLPTEKQEYQLKIDKVIKDSKLANQLVASWFNLSKDGKINFDLIAERGSYNASELEIQVADGQERGSATTRDAGKELIRNTFVTFTKLEFIENEPVAAAIRDAAKVSILESMAGSPQMLIDKALMGADKVYEKTKEGYSLWSKTWLYRLNWNDTIYMRLSTDYKKIKGDAFKNADYLSLEFVGVQYNQSLVTFKLGETRTQEQIIDLALVRNIDKAFAELQKENDVFKAKTPVITSSPITAQVGLKESLSGGEKFAVLEIVLNPKTGLTEYKQVATVTVDKKLIWDNRYNAGEESAEQPLDKNGVPIKATHFKGGKVQVGMLLKQIK